MASKKTKLSITPRELESLLRKAFQAGENYTSNIMGDDPYQDGVPDENGHVEQVLSSL